VKPTGIQRFNLNLAHVVQTRYLKDDFLLSIMDTFIHNWPLTSQHGSAQLEYKTDGTGWISSTASPDRCIN